MNEKERKLFSKFFQDFSDWRDAEMKIFSSIEDSMQNNIEIFKLFAEKIDGIENKIGRLEESLKKIEEGGVNR